MSDIVKHLRAGDPSVNEMAADLIEARRAESDTLRATIADLADALEDEELWLGSTAAILGTTGLKEIAKRLNDRAAFIRSALAKAKQP
jgi:hypothetical protein